MPEICFRGENESIRDFAERALHKDISNYSDDDLVILLRDYDQKCANMFCQFAVGLDESDAKGIVKIYENSGAVAIRVASDNESHIILDKNGNEIARFVDITGSLSAWKGMLKHE